jgi:hypothetical protein
MTTRASRLAAGLLLGVLVVVAGCSSDESSQSPRPEAASDAPDKALAKGTCWGDEHLLDALGQDGFDKWVEKYAGGEKKLGDSMLDDAAFSNEIDCAKPHSLELYNVVELARPLDAKVKNYADLLGQKAALYSLVRDQVNERCQAGSAYGKAQRKAGGMPVQLGPSLNVHGGLHVAWDPFPADLWAKGQRKFVCTFQQDEPGTLRFADVTTSKVPLAARVCLNTPRKYVPCSGKHQAEDIAEMILNTAIDKGQIDGRTAVREDPKGDYVALSDAEYTRLDKICQTLLSSVSTVKGGVEARAFPGGVSQWPADTGAYIASCFALKPVAEPPPPKTGTVFNKD